MIRPLRFSLLIALMVGIGAAEPVMSQSVLVTRGLGLPVEPQDARSRGLGGVGIGLPDGEISWLSPAGLFGLPAPAFVASYQYDNYTASGEGSEFTGNTARFPFILGAFPAGPRLVLFAGFGAYLDQNWRIESADTIIISGDSVSVLDESSSSGGVSRLRVGGTYEITNGLGLALGVDVYTGEVDRVQGRVFPNEFGPACCRSRWNYSGLGYTAAVHWAPSSATGVAASLTYGGSLEASPDNAAAEARNYDLPIMARAGVSGRIGQNTLVALSGGWDGWSSMNEVLADVGGTRDSWSVHGGLEWDAVTLRNRPLPVRIGARTGTLPFRWNTAEGADGGWVSERAATAGAGVVLGGGAVRTDFSIEAGDRIAGTQLDESFWRFGLSVRIFGR